MTSEPPSQPQKHFLQKYTEEFSSLALWIRELILKKNWFTLLLLAGTILYLFLKPGDSALIFLKDILHFKNPLPIKYSVFFWLIVGSIFLIALLIAIFTRPRHRTTPIDTQERRAIKGLRPFGFDDADVFTRLQRDRDLREYYESITSSTFRFGILMGESGCGKTSLLQAGLLPRLSNPEKSFQGVYISFSDRDPFETVCQALVDQLKIPPESRRGDFLEMLEQRENAAEKQLVLLFDQFEQFFIHYKQQADRETFVGALTTWYRSSLKVKVLISIRSDLSDRLLELERAFDYSPGPQEKFRLEKFSPEEATNVLEVIAELEKLAFERPFIHELAKKELASHEDGLIAPVDLQILAWMLDRQNESDARAFNQKALAKLGGIEGLLTRFLQQTLKARTLKSDREDAVKVLLTLTDLDRNVRAGVMTPEELHVRLKDTVTVPSLEKTLTWLKRGDVRLITPVEQDGKIGYELAHERMISAVRQIAGKELSVVEKANQLLDRRVNEWVGNQQSRRYLLSCRELWLIQKQKPFLMWGANRSQKERLIQLSKRQKLHLSAGIIGSLFLLSMVLVGWFNTTWGQIQQVQWQLKNLTSKNKRASDRAVSQAALAFAKNNDFINALQISKRGINSSEIKIQTLSAVAEVYINNKNENGAREILIDSLDIAKKSKELDDSPKILNSIIKTTEKFRNKTISKGILDQAVNTAIKHKYFYEDPRFLGSIASAYAGIGDKKTAEEFLLKTLKKFKGNEEFYELVDGGKTLSMVAEVYISLKDKNKAQKLLQKYSSVFTKPTQSSIDSNHKLLSFISLSRSYIKLGDEVKAADTLKKAINISAKVGKYYEFSSSDVQTNVFGKTQAIHLIVESVGELKDINEAKKLLRLSIATSEKFESEDRIQSKIEISKAYIRLGDRSEVKKLLPQIFDISRNFQDLEQKTRALIVLAEAHAKLDDWKQALQTEEQCTDDTCKVEALSKILEAYAEKKNPSMNKIKLTSDEWSAWR
jgi:tetratricopeptide (TPR) repeat protein